MFEANVWIGIVLRVVAATGLTASLAYTAFAILRVAMHRRRTPAHRQYATGTAPSVAILKPLCGAEVELEKTLRSFCAQDYPNFEVIFAVRDPDDSAVEIARRITADTPNSRLVVDGRIHGTNYKVSNLMHAAETSNAEIFVAADSDMHVTPDYLGAVVGAFEDETVGAVTCLYTGAPAGGAPSILGAMHINEVFLPSVLVALALEPLTFCLGATMAVRRSALARIGGFERIANVLADDHELGKAVHEAGLKVVLAPYVLETLVFERDFSALLEHELRWERTIRAARPAGFALTILMKTSFWATLFLLASGFSLAGWIAFGSAAALRLALHAAVRRTFQPRKMAAFWWIPMREVLDFAMYSASHFGRRVLWKGTVFRVTPDGQLQQEDTVT